MIRFLPLLLLLANPAETLKHHTSSVGVVAYSPDSRLLATGSTDRIVILDTTNWKPVQELDLKLGRIGAAVFSPDNSLLAVGGWNGGIEVWRFGAKQKRWELLRTYAGHKGALCALRFSRDGKHLASGDWKGFVHLWKLESPEGAGSVEHGIKGIADMVWTSKGRLVVVDRSGLLDSFQIVKRTGRLKSIGMRRLGTEGARFFRFSPDGRHLLAGDGVGLALMDLHRGREVRKFADQGRCVTWAEFSMDGQSIVASIYGPSYTVGAVYVVKDGTRKETLKVSESKTGSTYGVVMTVACSPDGRQVAVGCGKGQVLIFKAP